MKAIDPDRRLVQAQSLDRRIRATVRKRNEYHAELAFELLEMDEERLYVPLGFRSTGAYSAAVTGESPGKTSQLLAIARRLQKFPRMRAAFLAGEIQWTKARTAAKAAERDGEEEVWTELSRSLTSRELERLASTPDEDRPRLERLTFVIDVTPEQREAVEDAISAEIGSADEALTRSKAVLRIIERSRGGRRDPATRAAAPEPTVSPEVPVASGEPKGGEANAPPETPLDEAEGARRVPDDPGGGGGPDSPGGGEGRDGVQGRASSPRERASPHDRPPRLPGDSEALDRAFRALMRLGVRRRVARSKALVAAAKGGDLGSAAELLRWAFRPPPVSVDTESR